MAFQKKNTSAARRYSGPLAEPIRVKYHRSTLLGATVEEADQLNAKELEASLKLMLGKIDLLFDHYGVPRTGTCDDWASLAIRLALEHVPGFQVDDAVSKRGRPSTAAVEFNNLLADLELVKIEFGATDKVLSDAQSVEHLMQKPPYSTRWARYAPESIRNKLSRARDPKNNPLSKFWQFNGEAGHKGRECLISIFGVTKNAA